MPFADVGGLRVHYQQAGRGPDVVMVHGLGANLAFWYLSVVPALAREFRVTTYDLRGHGRSDMPPRGYGAAEQAGDLEGLLDALGVPEAHLVGHSFGTQVVLRCAVDRPGRVRSLVLADPVLPLPPRPWSRRDWRRFVVVSRQLRELGIGLSEHAWRDGHGMLDALADPEVRRARGARGGGREGTVPFGLWNGGGRTADQWRRLLGATSAERDFRAGPGLSAEQLRRLDRPALVTCGARSRYLPVFRLLRRTLPRCAGAVVPGAGHFHPLVRPEPFTRHLLEFLRPLAGAPPERAAGARAA